MGTRFYSEFVKAFLLSISLLVGLGYAVVYTVLSTASAPPPRDVFRTGFFEFDLAPGWSCTSSGTEYVCRPSGKPPLNAIAVIALKERNSTDNLDSYEAHMRQTEAEVRFVRRRMIRDQEWVEALHSGSELPNFLTYYLATTTTSIGILVTMSVHETALNKYIKDLG